MNKCYKLLIATLLIVGTSLFIYFYIIHSCETCKLFDTDWPSKSNNEKIDISLKIDCTNEDVFQPFHIDMINSFGIFGKVTLKKVPGRKPDDLFRDNNSEIIDQIEFKIFEVGTCTRFRIEDVKYVGMQASNSEHTIKFTVEKIGLGESNKSKILHDDIEVRLNELVDAKIISKDRRIRSSTKRNTSYKEFLAESSDVGIETYFPPLICQGRITDGVN